MGRLGALRVPGRARGVKDHRGVGVAGVRDPEVGGGGGEQIGEATPSTTMVSAPACSAPPGLLGEPVPREQQPGPGVAQVVGDLPPLEQRVHRDDDAARPEHAVVLDRDLGDVGHREANPVAGPEAALV